MKNKCAICGTTPIQICFPKHRCVVMGINFGFIEQYRCEKHKVTNVDLDDENCIFKRIEEYNENTLLIKC